MKEKEEKSSSGEKLSIWKAEEKEEDEKQKRRKRNSERRMLKINTNCEREMSPPCLASDYQR